MNYVEVAKQILESVGGSENIISMAHCATRLRLIVANREIIDDDEVEAINGIKGVFFNAGQYQIILGTGVVNKVYEEVAKLGVNTLNNKEIVAQKNTKKAFIRTLADVFVPIIPAIVATGLFLGLKGLIFNPAVLEVFGLSIDSFPSYIITFISILTETAFAFLPALVCWSAFRVFGGTPVLGILLGLMLVSNALPNAYVVADPNSGVTPIMVFGFIPMVGYQGSIIPALVSGYVGSNIEKYLRKKIPNALDLVFTPFLTLLLSAFLALFAIGPVFHVVENLLLDIGTVVMGLPYGIGGFIIGFCWMFIVITGVHHVFNVLELTLLAATGLNPFNAIISMTAVAQGAVCLAIAKKAKKKSVREIGPSATVSAWLGITEPAIFGVNMRYNLKPMLIASIVSGFAGVVCMLVNLAGTANGVTGIAGILLYVYDIKQLLWYVGISVATGVLAYFLTLWFGVPDEVMKDE
ncbi:PTS transporter subunit EIIC [Candidatus Epulonipiscium viviparus]|uniref:PTS transporter subunit EIIC n=1 Tax=Candidatus Epulonipiscium viviparus TaxID=420336 RepID=UPI0027380A15|nr:PTS transporter subunit EIIC [Candidatus Epulopiscium viviparus]